jgi:hypothetical protein
MDGNDHMVTSSATTCTTNSTHLAALAVLFEHVVIRRTGSFATDESGSDHSINTAKDAYGAPSTRKRLVAGAAAASSGDARLLVSSHLECKKKPSLVQGAKNTVSCVSGMKRLFASSRSVPLLFLPPSLNVIGADTARQDVSAVRPEATLWSAI